jgi:hypothetical protein
MIPRARWHLAGNVVALDGGFEPGRIYELAYRAANPPVAALGFAAVRDAASWVRYALDATVSAKYVFAFGSSQTGRFLREFLYDGFYTDERNRREPQSPLVDSNVTLVGRRHHFPVLRHEAAGPGHGC